MKNWAIKLACFVCAPFVLFVCLAIVVIWCALLWVQIPFAKVVHTEDGIRFTFPWEPL